jgi:S1-C subfamily serine protease
MKSVARPVVAAALIAAGVVGDRALSAYQTPSVDAAPVVASATNASSPSNVDSVVEHAFAVASPSVVYINNVGVGSGSGVIYDRTGDIVTNAHVVSGAQSLRVTLSSGKSYGARIVGTDTADDLAVIHINASNLPAATFASAGSFRVAQTVLAIGNPLDLQQSVTSGLISALNRTVQESNGAYLPNAIQTSAPINPGNSGGALVTLNGTVVGIPTLEATDPQNNNGGAAQGIGFAVPSTRVTFVAHQIIATGKVQHTGRAYLGVGATDAASAANSPFGQGNFGGGTTTPVSGALVQQVASGSPAANAGVQQGDVITAVNGTSISGEADLLAALAKEKPGDSMKLTLNRNGSTVQATVHLGELPSS